MKRIAVIFLILSAVLCRLALSEEISKSPILLAQQAGSLQEAVDILNAAQTQIVNSVSGNIKLKTLTTLADISFAKGKLYIAMNENNSCAEFINKAAREFQTSISTFIRIEKNADQKSRIEEKRLGNRYARKTPLWQNLKETQLKAKLNLAWSKFYFSKVVDSNKANRLLRNSIMDFKFFQKNGISTQSIVLDSFIGSASCWLEKGNPRKALKMLGSDELNPLNIDLQTYGKIALIRSKAYEKTASSIGVENNTKSYFDMLDEISSPNNTEKSLAKLRLKHLAKLSSDTKNNPYHMTHFKILDEFSMKLYANSEMRKIVLETINSCNIKLPCYYHDKSLKLLESNNTHEAIVCLEEFINTNMPKKNNLSRQLHQKLIVLYFNDKRFIDCFNSFSDYAKLYNLNRSDTAISEAAIESGLNLLERKLFLYCDEIESLTAQLSEKEILDTQYLTEAKVKFLIAQNMLNKALTIIDKSCATAPASQEIMLLKSITTYKLSRTLTSNKERKESLLESIDTLKKAGLINSQNSIAQAKLAKQLVVLIAKELLELPQNNELEALQTLELLGEDNSVQVTLLKIFIESKTNSSCAIEEKLRKLSISENQSQIALELLIGIIGNIEQSIEKQGWQISENSKPANQNLITIHKFIFENCGKNLSRSNESILRTNLANSYYYAGKTNSAADTFAQLSGAGSLALNSESLYNLADSLEAIGSTKKGIVYWKLLSRKLTKLETPWLEVNERLIKAWLACGDKETSNNYLQYFLLKYEQRLPAFWLERFKSLAIATAQSNND